MSKMKLVLLSVIAIQIVLLAGCGNSQGKVYLEGTYIVTSLEDGGRFYNRNELEQMYEDIAPVFSDYFYIEFSLDGTFVSPMVNGEGGTYYLQGDRIFAEDAEEKYTGKAGKDRITLVDETGMEFTFEAE